MPEPVAPLPPLLVPPVAPVVGLLLESRIPARLAWVSGGAPRVVPIWFAWTGTHLAMATFAKAEKLKDISDGTPLAVTIDTEAFPYQSLKLRGPAEVSPSDGLADVYRQAADRYLGPDMSRRWQDFLGTPDQVVIALRPTWARFSDMATQSPFLSPS